MRERDKDSDREKERVKSAQEKGVVERGGNAALRFTHTRTHTRTAAEKLNRCSPHSTRRRPKGVWCVRSDGCYRKATDEKALLACRRNPRASEREREKERRAERAGLSLALSLILALSGRMLTGTRAAGKPKAHPRDARSLSLSLQRVRPISLGKPSVQHAFCDLSMGPAKENCFFFCFFLHACQMTWMGRRGVRGSEIKATRSHAKHASMTLAAPVEEGAKSFSFSVEQMNLLGGGWEKSGLIGELFSMVDVFFFFFLLLLSTRHVSTLGSFCSESHILWEMIDKGINDV